MLLQDDVTANRVNSLKLQIPSFLFFKLQQLSQSKILKQVTVRKCLIKALKSWKNRREIPHLVFPIYTPDSNLVFINLKGYLV